MPNDLAMPATANWMSGIADDVTLNRLSLPGSHDTCAYTVEDSLAKTQGASLSAQLARGVRVLDIRCRHEGDVFHINHARIALGLMFDDVIAICAAFLARHPGECIVMSVKDECGDRDCTRSFAQTFASYVERDLPDVSEAPDVPDAASCRWYLGATIPRLGEVRGSIVLLRRFACESVMGIDLSDWPDNATFDIDLPGASFAIQDEYRVPVEASIDYKYGRIEALLVRTGQIESGRWVVNFCSGTGMGANPHRIACGGERGPGLNDRVAQRLTTLDGPSGTLMIDFCEHAHWALVGALVARNAESHEASSPAIPVRPVIP